MEKLSDSKNVKKAVIMVGGLGTRFLPATLCLAKELFPIGGKPIFLYQLEDLKKAGIDDILVVGNRLKEESFRSFLTPPKDYLNKIEQDGKLMYLEEYYKILSGLKITYVNQDDDKFCFDGKNVYDNEVKDKRGSSVAIYAAKYWAENEPFLVVNGDDLCFYKDGKSISKEVIDSYRLTGDNIIYGREMPRDLIWKYSAMQFDDNVKRDNGAIKILGIVEKPERGTEPSNIMGFARYLFTGEIFDLIYSSLPRKNGEFCITDVVETLAKQGKVSTVIFDGDYFDCGSMAGYVLANTYAGLHDEGSKNQVIDGLEKILPENSESQQKI